MSLSQQPQENGQVTLEIAIKGRSLQISELTEKRSQIITACNCFAHL